MSLNYLSSYMVKTLGLPMTGHQKYLMDLYEKLPVINTVGSMDVEGNYLSYENLDETYGKELEEYHKIIYNYMFDKDTIEDYFRLK